VVSDRADSYWFKSYNGSKIAKMAEPLKMGVPHPNDTTTTNSMATDRASQHPAPACTIGSIVSPAGGRAPPRKDTKDMAGTSKIRKIWRELQRYERYGGNARKIRREEAKDIGNKSNTATHQGSDGTLVLSVVPLFCPCEVLRGLPPQFKVFCFCAVHLAIS